MSGGVEAGRDGAICLCLYFCSFYSKKGFVSPSCQGAQVKGLIPPAVLACLPTDIKSKPEDMVLGDSEPEGLAEKRRVSVSYRH